MYKTTLLVVNVIFEGHARIIIKKSPVNLATYRTLAEREVPEPNQYNSLIFSCLHITTFLRVASIRLNCEYFVIMQ